MRTKLQSIRTKITIHEDQIKIIYVNAMNSDTDTDTKGVLGNTIAFVSTTLSIKPVFYNFDEGVKDEENTSRA